MSHAVPTVVGRHRAAAPTPVRRPQAIAPSGAGVAASGSSGRSGQRAPRGSVPARLGSALLSLLLAACLLSFLVLAVGPHVFGYRTATMLTGSMAPGIMPGDVVVTAPRPAADVEVGDVISYQIPIEDHRVETHRVTEVIHGDDGTVAVRTQGDANANVDPWTAVLDGDVVWEVQGVIPEIGTVIRALHHPFVSKGLLWVAIAGTLLLGLTTIWSKDEADPADADLADGEQE
ncbi:hypothetical protein NPS01_32420 [Nocardioides psychrotolerans]|uniref:Signal peptidase I n=1 Tax=Nocardioides psychrotolerans TaxID=1005945 RepID=A0A1I3NYM0_9ACTN|nr:signal peptidase I [Nocardioides psychrotolerans]GEP39579.1 hypothetical protein NPS01_32420 [Nocardioides psychrotolerans]SFJ14404.1 signal peptidase, endoplasmic reticulum-type [Nocardioides psychrotolerans]